MNLSQRWLLDLESLHSQQRFRSLHTASGVDFSSNDYLGYGSLRAPAAAPDTLSRSGAASRLLRGHHPIWNEVETELARWHGAEAVLMMSSGYMANLGLLSTVIEPGDWVASDGFNHASIIDGLRLARGQKHIYPHSDLVALQRALDSADAARLGSSDSVARFVVTESLFSMEGDTASLKDIVELADRYEAMLIVDEAHATGCFGEHGSGLVDASGLRGRVLATVHTGGKALGVPGAYICCSALLKNLLVNRCRQFLFTTALPPLVGQWWLDALQRVRNDGGSRSRLHENAYLFRDALCRQEITALGEHFIVPVVLGSDCRAIEAASRLQNAGLDIRAIRPPTVPEGTSRLRISVHADHDPDTLHRAAAAVAEAAHG